MDINVLVTPSPAQTITIDRGIAGPQGPAGPAGGGATSVSVISSNGLAGTVANPTTTPAITLSTTVTGIIKGNGTALSAAIAGTDYAVATSGSSILYGNSTGGFSNVTVGTGLNFAAGTLSSTLSGGDVSGPASSTDNAIARFDGVTGKIIQNSSVQINDSGEINVGVWKGSEIAVLYGGTGANNAGSARLNLNAAASGANTDITSVALTTGTISTTPTASTDIVNKTYVDSTAQGLNFHAACEYTSTVNLTATYNNGTSGVGATLTNSGTLAALTIDGYTFVSPADIGSRVLIKNQSAASENGVYTVTTVGSGSVAWVLTRSTDFNTAGSGANQIDAGDFFYIISGSAYANTSWVQQTPLPITVGVTSLVFIQFGAAAAGVTSFNAGTTGLTPSTATTGNVTLSGTLSAANGGTGSTSLTTNNVLLGNGVSPLQTIAPGANGNVLTSTGTTWTSATPAATGATKGQAISFSLIFGL